ncbi:hypothetical protein LEP1GSC161_4074 [Leptospira santarosai str. CBC1416]|uniref:Uncharacterized protein n=2 Tax=Leptospira santarosai TaxID=28183 RepID=M6UQI8_9LEPT|nr:hypothetical protein LEP1GSC175_0179 [Leptospira santarosai str. HAI821]EMO43329.1 hypothetical protein LEP1GSC187_0575 [Leptospira santarosai str. ZUN179]EMO58680.1 hypothetical protein LEP1GSC161_4074 [Leptospira santarosai str. CBC1416]
MIFTLPIVKPLRISRLTFYVTGSSCNSPLVWKKQNEYLRFPIFLEKISII